MPYFICPNCKERSIDHDRRASMLDTTAVGCARCGFGFLFELMDDYYPAPTTGFVVCDRNGRVLAAGRGVFELTGYTERDLMGHDVEEALALNGAEPSPIATALEWGVRQLGRSLELRTAAGAQKRVTVDLFPAYDEDGGLLVALTPS
ncbi:MAG TPA: PAS domain-containing protein [Gaiellaceae bacterium]|nr:PAS domain-containing protein [Gaiellaceae bacterium]